MCAVIRKQVCSQKHADERLHRHTTSISVLYYDGETPASSYSSVNSGEWIVVCVCLWKREYGNMINIVSGSILCRLYQARKKGDAIYVCVFYKAIPSSSYLQYMLIC